MYTAVRACVPMEGVTLSTHCHDDLGLAVANTLAGVEGGLLLTRAARDPGPLRTVAAELAALLRDRLPVDG